MKVTRIRAGVFRMELKSDEELEIHQLAAERERTFEEQIEVIFGIGLLAIPIRED